MTCLTQLSADAIFNRLATEYYDPILHPTCNNFRLASMEIVHRWVENRGGQFCEVGCGKSIVAEFLIKHRSQLTDLLLTDSSSAMLEHSREWEKLGATLKVATANRLPVADSSVDTLVASLGDPYNDRPFWLEARRVLSPSGLMVFTIPSYQWASSFRQDLPNTLTTEAEFALGNGQRLWVPSLVYSEEDQTRLIEDAGLSIAKIESVNRDDLRMEKLSPKLLVLRDRSDPVVTGYVVTR
jgi:ubiquinone/menaquinone biosynthesis C-methylase UbiE